MACWYLRPGPYWVSGIRILSCKMPSLMRRRRTAERECKSCGHSSMLLHGPSLVAVGRQAAQRAAGRPAPHHLSSAAASHGSLVPFPRPTTPNHPQPQTNSITVSPPATQGVKIVCAGPTCSARKSCVGAPRECVKQGYALTCRYFTILLAPGDVLPSGAGLPDRAATTHRQLNQTSSDRAGCAEEGLSRCPPVFPPTLAVARPERITMYTRYPGR